MLSTMLLPEMEQEQGLLQDQLKQHQLAADPAAAQVMIVLCVGAGRGSTSRGHRSCCVITHVWSAHARRLCIPLLNAHLSSSWNGGLLKNLTADRTGHTSFH